MNWCIPVYCLTDTPLFLFDRENAPVTEVECEGPCCEMRRCQTTNGEAPDVGPSGIHREAGSWGTKVNEKGLLQVSFSYCPVKRDPDEGWYARQIWEWWQDMVLKQIYRKYFLDFIVLHKEKQVHSWDTANVLLEFMLKSNNTKRNERWGNSGK